jgi:hypothetical protein
MFPFDPDRCLRDLLLNGIRLDRCEQVTGAVSNTEPRIPLPVPLGWQGIMFTLELAAGQ